MPPSLFPSFPYYPVVPAVVGLDVAGKMGSVVFVIWVDESVSSCNENFPQPNIFLSTE